MAAERHRAGTMNRRRLLRAGVAEAAFAATGAVLAACGEAAAPTATTAASTVKPTAAAVTAATSAPTAMSAPTAASATGASSPAAPAATTAATTAPTSAATVAPTAAAAPTSGATATGATAVPSAATAMTGLLPAAVPGANDAYIKYPVPFKTINMVPGKGGKLTIFKASQLPPPTPKEQNGFWQELDKRLGVTTEYTLATVSGYREKFAALAASGDFSDINLLWPVGIAPDQYKLIQQGAFTDLTPYLGTADARKEYPNLSKYPDFAWKNSLIRGKLFWVPRMNFLWGGNELMYRRDWGEKLGIPQPRNADEFFNLMVAITKGNPAGAGQQSWGLGGYNTDFNSGWSMGFIMGMFRVPNNWRKNADGTLTKDIETDEFKQAITFAKKLFDAGVYHPDTGSWTQTQAQDAMISGKLGAKGDSLIQLLGGAQERQKAKKLNPAADLRMLVPPGFDGGKGTTFNQPGVPYSNGIPAKVGKDTGRVKDILRIMDYFGALFGSEEYTFLTYGIRDRDHTINANGSPVLTDQGKAEVNELGNISFPPRVYYFPEDPPEDTIYVQSITNDALAEGIDDATLGLYSPTFVAKAAELNQLNIDRKASIITGRDPLTALDTWLKDWRSRGGDMMRTEYQQELKATQ